MSNKTKSTVDIVIIDDDKLTLEIASWSMRGSYASHKLFSEFQQAMLYFETVSPRILIVDYYMPEMNGVEFLMKLQRHTDLTDTNIYLCSAVTLKCDELSTTKDMGMGLLDKGVICSKKALSALIDQHCQKI